MTNGWQQKSDQRRVMRPAMLYGLDTVVLSKKTGDRSERVRPEDAEVLLRRERIKKMRSSDTAQV